MKKSLFLTALSVIAFAACQESVTPENAPALVQIEPLITRATEVNFEEGDKIGVTITKADGTVFADNALLTYAGAAFSGDQKWYADGGETCSIKAFYPYAEGGFPTSFTVGPDQTSGAGAYDLMTASKTGVKPQESPVAMIFKHQLSQIVLNVTNTADVQIDKFVLKGLIPTVNLSVAEDGAVVAEADASAAKVDITAECVTPGIKYRAIVVPQTMSFGVSLIAANGNSVVQNFNDVTMKPGYSYSIDAEVRPDGVVFSLSGEIEAWIDGGSLTPGEGGDEEEIEFEEHDGYFIYHDLNYKTITLANGSVWMAEPMAYLPKGVTASDDPSSEATIFYPYVLTNPVRDTTYKTDGVTISSIKCTGTPVVKKDAETIKAKGYLYTFDAIFGEAVTAANYKSFNGAQGICPDGWHVPTRDDWFALIGNSLKADGESAAPADKKDAIFYDEKYKGAKVENFDNGGFNLVLSGSAAMTTSRTYGNIYLSDLTTTNSKYYGIPSMTYLAGSTASSSSLMFMCPATTFTLAAFPEGRVSIMSCKSANAVQLRCVKDAE